MDAEIIKDTRLDINEFNQLVKMLQSSNEDFDIACENVKNLNLNHVLLLLIVKFLTLYTRRKFIAYLKTIDININSEDLTFKNIHSIIPNDDYYKSIFEGMVNNSISASYLDLEDNDYIESIKVKIKW